MTVQIEEERIVDHHRSFGHVRQQLQRAAVVVVRINERVVEAREILCVRTGDIDLRCGFHPTGGAGILRHGFSICRAVIADLLADGTLAVFPVVLARAHGHFVCCFGGAAQVERGIILPEQALAVQIVGKLLAADIRLDAVAVIAFLERAVFQHGIAVAVDQHTAGVRAAVKLHRAIGHIYQRDRPLNILCCHIFQRQLRAAIG